MSFLKKIQDQPKNVRKAIFWVTITIVGAIFLFAWVQVFKARVEQAREKNLLDQYKLPGFEEGLKDLPKIETPEIPEFTEEELKALEEADKKIQEENQKSFPQTTNP